MTQNFDFVSPIDRPELADQLKASVDACRLEAGHDLAIMARICGADLIEAGARITKDWGDDQLPDPYDINWIRNSLQRLDHALAAYGAGKPVKEAGA